jgi:alcohol dehydrogenase class IV
MHSFEFATATRIVFGNGKLREAGAIARDLGRQALVVTGTHTERAEPLLASLAQAGVAATSLVVPGEPTLASARWGTDRARAAGCDLVIGLGGGSALDTAKAIAALLANGGDPLDYLEVIGKGRPLTQPSLPMLAIPTTAGTGTEVTRNAVLGSPEHKVKVSLRGPGMLPRVALIDPELTLALPPAVTAATGLDALTQLIEPFVSSRANPLVDALCRDGIRRAATALPRVFQDGTDAAARTEMAVASLFGGLALANAGLGAVHGLAAPIGGMFAAPHGAVCAALLPHVMAINIRALEQRELGNPALHRYFELARLLNNAPAQKMADGVRWVRDTVAALQIPGLGRYGITSAAFPALVAQAAKASSMKANPIVLTSAELTEILERAL